MSESPLRNRDEKEDEKRHEKDEKGRSDPLGTVVWGAIIIWAGIVLLLENLGFLAIFSPFRINTWGLIFLGAGIILLAQVAARMLLPTYRRHYFGTLVLAFVFIAIGLGNLVNWGVLWAVFLIALGVVILIRSTGRRI